MEASKGGGPEGGGPKISLFFFPLPSKFRSFFSLWGLLVELWSRFKAMTQPIVRVWGSLRETPVAPREKKARNFGPTASLRDPHISGSSPFEAPPFGPSPEPPLFRAQQFWPSPFGAHPSRPPHFVLTLRGPSLCGLHPRLHFSGPTVGGPNLRGPTLQCPTLRGGSDLFRPNRFRPAPNLQPLPPETPSLSPETPPRRRLWQTLANPILAQIRG